MLSLGGVIQALSWPLSFRLRSVSPSLCPSFAFLGRLFHRQRRLRLAASSRSNSFTRCAVAFNVCSFFCTRLRRRPIQVSRRTSNARPAAANFLGLVRCFFVENFLIISPPSSSPSSEREE